MKRESSLRTSLSNARDSIGNRTHARLRYQDSKQLRDCKNSQVSLRLQLTKLRVEVKYKKTLCHDYGTDNVVGHAHPYSSLTMTNKIKKTNPLKSS